MTSRQISKRVALLMLAAVLESLRDPPGEEEDAGDVDAEQDLGGEGYCEFCPSGPGRCAVCGTVHVDAERLPVLLSLQSPR